AAGLALAEASAFALASMAAAVGGAPSVIGDGANGRLFHLDVEVYHDEGDGNLLNVIRLRRDMNWEGSPLADHSPSHGSDPNSSIDLHFANGYILGLLR